VPHAFRVLAALIGSEEYGFHSNLPCPEHITVPVVSHEKHFFRSGPDPQTTAARCGFSVDSSEPFRYAKADSLLTNR
jgi:hypothetical protein